MAYIRKVTLEGGALVGGAYGFDSAVIDGGDLSCATAAKMGYTRYGVSALINDANVIYGAVNVTAPTSKILSFGWYVDPNALAMGAGDTFNSLVLYTAAGVPGWSIVLANLRFTGGQYYVDCLGYDDAGAASLNDSVVISDAPHCVEVHIFQATNATSADGVYEWFVDGVSQGTAFNVDNFDLFANMANLYLGAVAGIDFPTTNGTLYFDELWISDEAKIMFPIHDIFNITLESNGLVLPPNDRGDSAVIDGGDLSVSAAAARACTEYGLSVLADDGTAIYIERNVLATVSKEMLYRIYFNKNTVSIANAKYVGFCRLYASIPGIKTVTYLQVEYSAVNGYKFNGVVYDDADNLISVSSAWIPAGSFIGNYWIDFLLVQATTNISGDGSAKFWVNGTEYIISAAYDNFDYFANIVYIRAGMIFTSDAGISGAYFLDEFRCNDTGVYIPPIEVCQLATKYQVDIGQISRYSVEQIASIAGVRTGN